jgi:preprotein translocase subunit SecG
LFVAWVVFHVIVCIALVLVVLMQSSKGEGLAGTAMGGGSGLSGAVFGGRGAASFLSKATTVLAILFMVNSGALALMSSQRSGVVTTAETPADEVESVVSREAQQELDQQLQLQQQQQAAGDTASPVQLIDDSTTPADTAGK